jgi:AsmA protein
VLEAAGARIAAQGEIAEPLQARGWRLALDATVPELQRLAPLLPDAPLPPLRDVALTAHLADSGAALPMLSDLRLTLGPAVLDALLPGLRLASLTASLPRQDQPLTLAGEATLNGVPLRLAGTLGAPVLLLPGAAAQPWPLDLALNAGAATATLQGAIADARAGTGVDLALALRVPELAAMSPLAGTALPPVREIALDTRVAERGPAFAGGAFLRGLRLTSSAADAAGELIYVVGQRRGVAGEIASSRIDLDALRMPGATPAPGTAPAAGPPAQDERVIPDLPLPLEALRVLDADLRWQIATLISGGVTYQEVRGALSVQDGRARLDPFTAALPGGRISLRGAADVTTSPPTVQLAARSEQIDLAVLLAAMGQSAQVAGLLGLDMDLRGQGWDLRAVAGTAHGHFGISLVRGQVSARLLDSVPTELRRLVVPPGQTNQDIGLRCLALRLAVENGMAQSRALLLETSIGRVSGEGGLNLGTEALAFRLLPDIRLGGVAVRAPVNVAGTLRTPRVGVSPEAAAAGGLGAFLSLQQTPDRNLQALAEAVGGGRPALPECEPQLAIARGGQPGPAPAAAPAAPAAERPPAEAAPTESLGQNLPAPAQELLRGLFGRGR